MGYFKPSTLQPPDLVQRDYHLSMHKKKWLSSKRFDDDDELRGCQWLAKDAGSKIFLKLVKRYKSLNLNGNYIQE